MKRRAFTKMAGLGAMAMYSLPALAFDSTPIPLGLCNHSLRDMRLNARQLLEYAIQQKLDSVLLNTFSPFESLESSHLSSLYSLAKANGVSIYVGVGSISENSFSFSPKYGSAEELLIEGIRVAGEVGSPIVGCRIGSMEDRYMEGGIESHMEAVIRVMKSVREQALEAGVKFAFENHCGDLRSKELVSLIQETGTDICGALFDPANALWAMEIPMQALDVLGSTTICTSVRDVTIWESEEGAIFQGRAIGEGIMNFPLFAETLSRLSPGVPLHVETISNSARPIPFLKPGFWKGYPDLTASDFMEFLRLVKEGSPLKIELPPAGMTQREFDIELQRSELLKSLDFLRDHCNIN
jgi:sugar phosphate isomerase/epimerase